jgi:hypothetical protein
VGKWTNTLDAEPAGQDIDGSPGLPSSRPPHGRGDSVVRFRTPTGRRFNTHILSRMSDEQPFYAPNHKPTVPRQPRPREAVWTVRKEYHTRTCELLDHGGDGIEVQILIDGDLLIGRRFETRALAPAWAKSERPS